MCRRERDGTALAGPGLWGEDLRETGAPNPVYKALVDNGELTGNSFDQDNGFDLSLGSNSKVIGIENLGNFQTDGAVEFIRFFTEEVAVRQRGYLSDLVTQTRHTTHDAVNEVFYDANTFTPIDSIIDSLKINTSWYYANFAYKLTNGWTIPLGAYYEETWRKEGRKPIPPSKK